MKRLLLHMFEPKMRLAGGCYGKAMFIREYTGNVQVSKMLKNIDVTTFFWICRVGNKQTGFYNKGVSYR